VAIEGVMLPHLVVPRALAAMLIRARLNPEVTILPPDSRA